MWEREKMLVASIFSYTHNVFKGFFFKVVKSRIGLDAFWLKEKKLASSIFSISHDACFFFSFFNRGRSLMGSQW